MEYDICPVGTKRSRREANELASHHYLSETMSHPPNPPLGNYSSTPTTPLTRTSTLEPLSNSSTPTSTTLVTRPYPYHPSTTAFASGPSPNSRWIPSTPTIATGGHPITPMAAAANTASHPETAGTMAPPPNKISLHCLCEGSSSVFPVQVCHDTEIAGVVEQVQKKAGLGEVSFVELELWKVRLLASS